MPRKHLFYIKRATGSARKSGSAADASVSSPEAKKPSSASGAEVLAEVPEERRSSPVLACTLKLAIPHGCPSSSLPGASNNRALQGMHQVGMDSTNLIVNSGSFSRAVSNIGLCSVCLAPLTHRHDLNSRRGLVSDLRWETGHVLEYVVKSKRCVVCARQTLDSESEEYAK